MPTNKRHYRLGFDEVLEIHDHVIGLFGGLGGIRDRSGIESAIGRPYSGYYRRIEAKAAAIVHSFALNHGFIDGNKRTAVTVVTLFLDRSGYSLRVDNEDQLNAEVEQMVLDVVEHRLSFDELVLWFRVRLVRDPTQTG